MQHQPDEIELEQFRQQNFVVQILGVLHDRTEIVHHNVLLRLQCLVYRRLIAIRELQDLRRGKIGIALVMDYTFSTR